MDGGVDDELGSQLTSFMGSFKDDAEEVAVAEVPSPRQLAISAPQEALQEQWAPTTSIVELDAFGPQVVKFDACLVGGGAT